MSALRCEAGDYVGICHTCGLLSERRRRAATGIPPRKFKNPSRGYTF
jgi:hypothetical protein